MKRRDDQDSEEETGQARNARTGSLAAESGQGDSPPDEATSEESAVAEAREAAALAQREAEEQRDKYLRLAAEYDNYRKRVTRERQETVPRAQAELLRPLLDSLDDLARVAHVGSDATDIASVVNGVDLVEQKMLKALMAQGLAVVRPVDEPFNPELHEAVATEPALSPEDDHMVSQVYQPGYLFKGQLLRPARVVVKQWTE